MKNFFRMKFPNGHVYQFPVELLVVHMANAFVRVIPNTAIEAANDSAREILRDETEVIKYARCVPWVELEPFAMLVEASAVEMHSVQAEVTCYDEPVMPSIGEGSDPGQVPVALVVAALEVQKEQFRILNISRNGHVVGAVAILRGGQDHVDVYADMIKSVSKELLEHEQHMAEEHRKQAEREGRPVYPH